MLEMMLPTLPMMVANTSTATRNSTTTKMYSKTVVGCGTSPIMASVVVHSGGPEWWSTVVSQSGGTK